MSDAWCFIRDANLNAKFARKAQGEQRMYDYKDLANFVITFASLAVKKKNNMSENEISRVVFDCALKVHKSLGPGVIGKCL